MVTRQEILTRCETAWGGMNKTPYSQDVIKGGYRTDCSGYASLVWGVPAGRWGGANTATLVSEGWMYDIPKTSLQLGDAVGVCGPGSEGDAGHIIIFKEWADGARTKFWGFEQAGGQTGPTFHQFSISHWPKAYRTKLLNDVTPGVAMELDTPIKELEEIIEGRPFIRKVRHVLVDLWNDVRNEIPGIKGSLSRIEAKLSAMGTPSGHALTAEEISAIAVQVSVEIQRRMRE